MLLLQLLGTLALCLPCKRQDDSPFTGTHICILNRFTTHSAAMFCKPSSKPNQIPKTCWYHSQVQAQARPPSCLVAAHSTRLTTSFVFPKQNTRGQRDWRWCRWQWTSSVTSFTAPTGWIRFRGILCSHFFSTLKCTPPTPLPRL
jgi:hypothetical protein